MNQEQGYLYETHFHTSWSSACARSRGPEYLQRYKALGYDGIMVTDHFWRGNCAVNRHLPWEQFVDAFCRGYEETKTAGEKMGLKIFFGWEETFEGDDYLVYGLDKAWLISHPEVRGYTRREQLEQVHKGGGCVVQAHPFRHRDYIHAIHLGLTRADAFEAYNASNDEVHDRQAFAWAQHNQLTLTSGSDIHAASQYEDVQLGGVYFTQPLQNVGDYVEAIRAGTARSLRRVSGRFEGELIMPDLPVWEHGKTKRRVREFEELFGKHAHQLIGSMPSST